MIEAGIWRPKKHRPFHRAWRPRRACVGELVQVDGSDHDWLEGRGPRMWLIAFVDDATSRLVWAEFTRAEDTLTLMRLSRDYMTRYGRPVAFYVDKDSIYTVNRNASIDEELRDEQPTTQFTRAMQELAIEVICAHSPQAKGRVERCFKTHQDRLTKELRLAGISTMEGANRVLRESYIAGHNDRFGIEPASSVDAHRPLLVRQKLEQILSLRTPRTLLNDFTLRYDNQFLQLLKEQPLRVRPGDRISVETRLDGTMHLGFKDSYLNFEKIDKRSYRPHLVAQPAAAKQRVNPHIKGVGAKPSKNHPWRRPFLPGSLHFPLQTTPTGTL